MLSNLFTRSSVSLSPFQVGEYNADEKIQLCADRHIVLIPDLLRNLESSYCLAYSGNNFFPEIAVFNNISTQVNKLFNLMGLLVIYSNSALVIGSNTHEFSYPCVDSKPYFTGDRSFTRRSFPRRFFPRQYFPARSSLRWSLPRYVFSR